MIEELFPTKSLYATLAIFFDYPDDPLHPRLIARATGIDIKCVRRQLSRLERSGVIAPRDAGKERRYRLRCEFPLLGELASIFGPPGYRGSGAAFDRARTMEAIA